MNFTKTYSLRLKNTLLGLFAVFISLSVQAQCDMTTRNMVKYLGTTSLDKANIVERIGPYGYIVGGSKAIGATNYLYIARLDLCGEVLWENLYNPAVYGSASGVIFKDDFIYIASYFQTGFQTSLIKLDLNGNVLDSKKFGLSATYPRRMIEMSDGNFLFCGTTNAPSGPGNNDFYLTKSTDDGTILWNRQIGGLYNDFGHNVMETADGSIIVLGYTRNYIVGVHRGLVMKFDASGNLLWSKEYHNGAQFTYLYFAIEVGGFYYYTGRGNNGTSGGHDGLVMKTTLDGDVVWSKFVGTANDDNMAGLAEKDGVLYVSGTAWSPTKGDEIIVHRMDYSGNMLDYTSFGTVNDEVFSGAFSNFGVEADGFYGVASGNTGLIGDNDILFYRFNSFAENCEPSDVTLTVIDAGMLSTDFSATSISPSWTMTAIPMPVTPVATADGFICETLDSLTCDSLITVISDTLVCDGDLVTLEATSINGGTITWDGGIINATPFTPPVGTTTYTATSDSTMDCTFSVDITVVPLPTVVANVDNTDICLGENVTFTGAGADTYDWDMGVTDGLAFEPLALGTEMYTVTGTDLDGCINQDSIEVTVHEIPIAHFEFVAEGVSSEMGSAGGCVENAVQFNDLSTVGAPETITVWSWNFGDGGTSADENPSHTYLATGIYTITLIVTTANGCTATYTLDITITGLILNITSIEPTCYGFTDGNVTANVTGETGTLTFIIADVDGNTRNIANSNIANGLGTGWYYFNITDARGCTTDGSVFLDHPDSLDVNFSFSPTSPKIDQEVAFTDHTIGATTWNWDFGDGYNSAVENPRHAYASLDTYIITLDVSDGVCWGSATATITIVDNLVFYVPNAFTPDGDSHNSTFSPVFTSGFDLYDYHITIFNRWGEVVFESFDAMHGWDGTYGNSNLVQDGVYVWEIEFGDAVTDDKYQHFGHITIIK